MGGKTEPALIFAGNRYAADDRTNFQALPLAGPGVKDRTFSSIGLFASARLLDWLSVGGSVNELNPQTGIPSPLATADIYSFVNVTLHSDFGALGEGEYRINYIVTDAQGDDPESDGWILSFDQELFDNFGAFFRMDNTLFQVSTSPLVESYAGGIAHHAPFGRSGDRLGVGLMRTKSERDVVDRWETGLEAFYRLGPVDWFQLTFALQAFNPALAEDSFVNAGFRVMIKL